MEEGQILGRTTDLFSETLTTYYAKQSAFRTSGNGTAGLRQNTQRRLTIKRQKRSTSVMICFSFYFAWLFYCNKFVTARTHADFFCMFKAGLPFRFRSNVMEMVMLGCFFRVGGNIALPALRLPTQHRPGPMQRGQTKPACRYPAQPAHRFRRGSRSKAIHLQSG